MPLASTRRWVRQALAIPSLTDLEAGSVFRQVARESVARPIRASRAVGTDPGRIRQYLAAATSVQKETDLFIFDRYGDRQGRLDIEILDGTSGKRLLLGQEVEGRGHDE